MDIRVGDENDLADLLAKINELIARFDAAGLDKVAAHADMARVLLIREIEQRSS